MSAFLEILQKIMFLNHRSKNLVLPVAFYPKGHLSLTGICLVKAFVSKWQGTFFYRGIFNERHLVHDGKCLKRHLGHQGFWYIAAKGQWQKGQSGKTVSGTKAKRQMGQSGKGSAAYIKTAVGTAAFVDAPTSLLLHQCNRSLTVAT